jgi:hypothetical protein
MNTRWPVKSLAITWAIRAGLYVLIMAMIVTSGFLFPFLDWIVPMYTKFLNAYSPAYYDLEDTIYGIIALASGSIIAVLVIAVLEGTVRKCLKIHNSAS